MGDEGARVWRAVQSGDGHFRRHGEWCGLAAVVDSHGDGVTDYNIQVFYGDDLSESDDPAFEPVKMIADIYSSDTSYRCFYIHLTQEMLDLKANNKKMWLELIASRGSELIEYKAYTGSTNNPH